MRPRTETGSETGSMPKTRTVPASARNKPRICLIKVVLPAPFSPTSPNTLPHRKMATGISFLHLFLHHAIALAEQFDDFAQLDIKVPCLRQQSIRAPGE